MCNSETAEVIDILFLGVEISFKIWTHKAGCDYQWHFTL